MATPPSLYSDSTKYLKAFKLFKERTTGYQSMNRFMDNQLPDILTSITNGKSNVNLIGVGSGSGELDLKILSTLHLKFPQITVENEAIDPNPQQLIQYKDLVSQTPGLDHIQFNWNEMTAEEFEEQWKEKKRTKKADFIHMFQVLYFMKDVGATLRFFHSVLDKNGKLFITVVSGKSGWGKLGKTYGDQLSKSEIKYVTTADIYAHLDSMGLSYQSYDLPCLMDITECFTEGDETGELMLDFLTEVLHFSKTVSPQLKAGIKEFLLQECCVESNGKVLLNHDYEMIVVDQLT